MHLVSPPDVIALSPAQILDTPLINAAAQLPYTVNRARVRLMAALLEECGLHRDEVCSLTVRSFDFVNDVISVKSPSGKHLDWATFGIETLIAYGDWMRCRDEGTDNGMYGLLLHDDNGAPLTPTIVERDVRMLMAGQSAMIISSCNEQNGN